MTKSEKQIEFIKLVQTVKLPDEKTGDTVLRSLRCLKAQRANPLYRYNPETGEAAEITHPLTQG